MLLAGLCPGLHPAAPEAEAGPTRAGAARGGGGRRGLHEDKPRARRGPLHRESRAALLHAGCGMDEPPARTGHGLLAFQDGSCRPEPPLSPVVRGRGRGGEAEERTGPPAPRPAPRSSRHGPAGAGAAHCQGGRQGPAGRGVPEGRSPSRALMLRPPPRVPWAAPGRAQCRRRTGGRPGNPRRPRRAAGPRSWRTSSPPAPPRCRSSSASTPPAPGAPPPAGWPRTPRPPGAVGGPWS